MHSNSIINILDLNHKVIETNSKQELNAIKSEIIKIDQGAVDIESTSYEKRRIKDAIVSLHRLIDLKLNSVDAKMFCFRNEPVPNSSPPINHQQPIFHSKPQNALAAPLVSDVANIKLTVSTSVRHLLMTNISRSILISRSIPSSVNIQNASNTIVHIHSTGPIFLHDLQNVVLILRCHQLRMHNVANSTILVDVANDKLIIENCHGLKIGHYPGLDSESCRRIQVDDFNKPTATNQSTNYSELQTQSDYGWIHNVIDGALEPQVQLLLP